VGEHAQLQDQVVLVVGELVDADVVLVQLRPVHAAPPKQLRVLSQERHLRRADDLVAVGVEDGDGRHGHQRGRVVADLLPAGGGPAGHDPVVLRGLVAALALRTLLLAPRLEARQRRAVPKHRDPKFHGHLVALDVRRRDGPHDHLEPNRVAGVGDRVVGGQELGQAGELGHLRRRGRRQLGAPVVLGVGLEVAIEKLGLRLLSEPQHRVS